VVAPLDFFELENLGRHDPEDSYLGLLREIMIKKIPIDQVVLSVHAVERLTERKISIEELESILTAPDLVIA